MDVVGLFGAARSMVSRFPLDGDILLFSHPVGVFVFRVWPLLILLMLGDGFGFN